MSAPFCVAAAALLFSAPANAQSLDTRLRGVLLTDGFTGTIESQLTDPTSHFLGREIDLRLVGLGSFLWFDPVLSIHDDATCASCHSPTNGWGDTQPIAIGVQSNYRVEVGTGRMGPRNLRRSPMTANAVFYPAQMWDGRFSAPSGNPFDNSQGFDFPAPEGQGAFANDAVVTHLLAAQAFLPVTEFVEMAGFTGTAGIDDELDAMFDVFDDGLGDDVPAADASLYRHDPIRNEILDRLNGYTQYRGAYITEYRRRFARLFDDVDAGGDITFAMVGAALAEFQFNQVAADSRFDKYARGGANNLLTKQEKQGALVFFRKGQCVSCHAVSGVSNEMFSDFQNHVIGVPQVAPVFGEGTGNVVFDGAGAEDYGRERTTGLSDDRYKFRTAPLRNLAMSPAYMHNGAFTDLEDAIRHHLDVATSQADYDVVTSGLADIAPDLTERGPDIDVSTYVDDALDPAPVLTDMDIANLVAFLHDALLDSKISATRQCDAAPDQALPSGAEFEAFPGCPTQPGTPP